MIFKESYGLCPYMSQMQKASKRNARIKNEQILDTDEYDISASVAAHIRRRKEKPAKDKWIRLANEAGRILNTDDPTDKKAVKEYLERARKGTDVLDRHKAKHRWIRTENISLNER